MFLSLLFCLAAFAGSPDLRLPELETKMDAFVKQFQPVENTGIAVGIVKDGELVYFKGYGYRDREKKLPVTEHTVFAIGSATKSFISTSLAMLEEEGAVDFNAPVKTYLPEFALETVAATEQATLTDLLSHQTGLPRHDLLWYLTPFTTRQLFAKLSQLEMDKRPGMGFRSGVMQYNNLMYMTAGLVLGKASGQSWQEFVKSRIVAPLGMNKTSFSLEGFDLAEAALPYAGGQVLPYKPLDAVGAAGSMNSTVVDLTKWVDLHLTKGKGLVSPESLEKLYQQHSDGSDPARGIELGYGLGMMIGKVGGKKIIYHGGNIDGFTAHVSFAPEIGIGLVVLVNQNGAGNFEYPMAIEEEKGKPPVPLFPYLIYEHFLSQSSEISSTSRQSLENAMAALNLPGLEAKKERADLIHLASASPYYFGGNFAELAYGNLSIVTKEDMTLSMNYYGTIFGLIATDQPNFFWAGIDGQKSEISVEFEIAGNVVTAVNVLFEKAVKPIRFVPVRTN